MNRWDDWLSRLPSEPVSPDLTRRICRQLRHRLRPSLLPFLSRRQARQLAWALDGLSVGLLLLLLTEGVGGSVAGFQRWWQSTTMTLSQGWNAFWMADWHFLGRLWNELQSWSMTVLPLALAFLALGLFLMTIASLSEWLKSDFLFLSDAQSRKNVSLHDHF